MNRNLPNTAHLRNSIMMLNNSKSFLCNERIKPGNQNILVLVLKYIQINSSIYFCYNLDLLKIRRFSVAKETGLLRFARTSNCLHTYLKQYIE